MISPVKTCTHLGRMIMYMIFIYIQSHLDFLGASLIHVGPV